MLKSEKSLANQDKLVSLLVWPKTAPRKLGFIGCTADSHVISPLLGEFKSKSVCNGRALTFSQSKYSRAEISH